MSAGRPGRLSGKSIPKVRFYLRILGGKGSGVNRMARRQGGSLLRVCPKGGFEVRALVKETLWPASYRGCFEIRSPKWVKL